MSKRKTFEIEVRIRNNLLKQRRVELGMSAKEFAAACGISYGRYLELEGLRKSPASARGRKDEWTSTARKIAEFLGEPPEELFPAEILAVRNNGGTVTMNFEEMKRLVGRPKEVPALFPVRSPEDLMDEKRKRRRLREVLDSLKPQYRRVIEKRFGLDGGEPATLKEIGEELGVQKERVRQVELKALRQIRLRLAQEQAKEDWQAERPDELKEYFSMGSWEDKLEEKEREEGNFPRNSTTVAERQTEG